MNLVVVITLLNILLTGNVVGGYGVDDLGEIDCSITEGETYGFIIGETKEETYHRAARMHTEKEITWLAPHISPELSRKIYGIDVYEPQSPEKVRDALPVWFWWMIENIPDSFLTKNSPVRFPSSIRNDCISLVFDESCAIKKLLYNYGTFIPANYVEAWPGETSGLPCLKPGISCDRTSEILMELRKRKGYENLTLRAKDVRKVSTFNIDQLSILQKWDIWDVRIDFIPYNDHIVLIFSEDKLVKIYRRRKYNPFPM